MYDCDAHFNWCWLAYKYVNCCELFSLQITEAGICYSYNSYSSVGSKLSNV